MKAIILIFFFCSCNYGMYPRPATNSCGKIVRKDKVNNVCEFDSVYLKIKK